MLEAQVIKPKMGFLDVIKRVVGSIPVKGTVGNAIEAGIDEAQGLDAEAKEKELEAGFDIVSYIVAAAVVVTVAVAAAVVVTVTVAAAVVVTATVAAALVARRKGPKRKKPQPKKRKEPSSNDTTTTHASALQEPKKPRKDPKRGHHVINNGVNRIFRDIIKKFFQYHQVTIFLDHRYEELKKDEIINKDDTPKLMESYDQTLPSDVSAQIEAMVADTPPGKTHTDKNDEKFGESKEKLLNAVTPIIFHVFTSLREAGTMPDLREESVRNKMESMTRMIASINKEGKYGVYVDNQALGWWLDNGGKKEQFIRCRNKVMDMFNSLADMTRQPDESIACIWGRELLHVYRQLTKNH